MDNPSYFIFPLLTCISFYSLDNHSNIKDQKTFKGNQNDLVNNDLSLTIKTENKMKDEEDNFGSTVSQRSSVQENEDTVDTAYDDADETIVDTFEKVSASFNNGLDDTENIETLSTMTISIGSFENCPKQENIENPNEVIEETLGDNGDNIMEFQFSADQSNILYVIFAVNFIWMLIVDIYLQTKRWGESAATNLPFSNLITFLVNLYLWVDFIIETRKRENPSYNFGISIAFYKKINGITKVYF